MKVALPAPTEEAAHRACVAWAQVAHQQYPLLRWLVHVPNGGKRPRGEAGKLRAMGTRKGVPDLLILRPSGRFHGLAVEVKSRTGRLTPEQQAWLETLHADGWLTGIVRSLDEFIEIVRVFHRG